MPLYAGRSLFYCASQILWFLHIEGSGNPMLLDELFNIFLAIKGFVFFKIHLAALSLSCSMRDL